MPRVPGKAVGLARAGLKRLTVIGWGALLPDRRPLTIFVGLLALTFLFDTLDSFGLDDAGDRAWGKAIEALRGPVYGSFADGRAAQRQIAVVLIDDRTFARNGQEGPPLAYGAQAEILNEVANTHPRAIFFDAYYPRSRLAQRTQSAFASLTHAKVEAAPDLVALAKTMQDVGSQVPLLIGPVSDADDGLKPIRKILAAPGIPGNWEKGVHQVSISTNLDDPAEYPLEPSVEAPALPSAALALYWSYCASREKACADVPGYSIRPMVVQWGLGVSQWRQTTLPPEERARCEGANWAIVRLLKFIWQGATRACQHGRTSHDDRLAGERCGYHDSLYAADLDDRAPDGTPLRDYLRGKIVFIGFDLPAGGDREVAPFYGDLPGVMTHAMAFDNLLTYHGRPAMKPAKIVAGLDEQDMLQYIGAAIALIISAVFSRNARVFFRVRDRILLRRHAAAGLTVLTIGLIGGCIMYFGYYRSWPLSSILLGGLLPGGIFGLALMFFARAGSGRKVA